MRVQVLEVRSELGAGTRGASLGIGAIKVASLNLGSNYFGTHPIRIIPNENEQVFQAAPTTPHAKYIRSIVKVYDYVVDAIKEVFHDSQDNFMVVLAGDHSTAGATIAGLRNAYPEKTLGVVWVDAHADLHTPYTTPSGNVHGMPLAASLGADNLDQKHNDLSLEEAICWNHLKYVGDVMPKIESKDLVFVAVRDTETEEDYLMQKLGLRNFTVAEVNEQGPEQIAAQILRNFEHCDMIYISFDVDSMDCHLVSKGTGTPVPDGLSEDQATRLICSLMRDPRTCCLEITEVNPTLDDKGNVMAETAFRILEQATKVAQQARSTVFYR